MEDEKFERLIKRWNAFRKKHDKMMADLQSGKAKEDTQKDIDKWFGDHEREIGIYLQYKKIDRDMDAFLAKVKVSYINNYRSRQREFLEARRDWEKQKKERAEKKEKPPKKKIVPIVPAKPKPPVRPGVTRVPAFRPWLRTTRISEKSDTEEFRGPLGVWGFPIINARSKK